MGQFKRAFTNRSLQSRLLLRLGGVCIFFCLLVGAALFLIYRSANSDILFGKLQEITDTVERNLQHQPDGSWRLNPDGISSSVTYLIRDMTGRELLRGGHDPDLIQPLPIIGLDGEDDISDFLIQRPLKDGHPLKRHVFTLVSVLTIDNQRLIVQITARPSATMVGIDALTQEWLGEFLPFAIPMSLVLLAVLSLTVRSALAPLERLQRFAAAIGPLRTDLRLPTDDLPAELLEPVRTINGALGRLDDGFRLQRDFMADAAHELRTPLAVLAAHLESLGGDRDLQPLRADVDRMTRLVGQMTMVAQLEALTIQSSDSADLSAISMELAALMAPLAISQKRGIAVNGAEQPILVRGNPDAIYQALRNLVENALRYTAEGTEVELTLDPTGKVGVADRGPGIPAADRQRLFHRFWRADRRSTGNAGLGLAIAQRIAELHHGSLSVDDNPGGGARFTLQVPLLGRT
jgi:signal transduction histidine kinase